MWLQHKFTHDMHPHPPVITAIRMWVEGNENNFVRDLDRFELERLSRGNCHPYSDWRALHEAGQGILLHLRDIGLTNEKPFPKKKRVHIKIELLQAAESSIDDAFMTAKKDDIAREFHVCILRSNQLFTSSQTDCRFEFLNEKLIK